jgi:hypothetical protein
VSQLVGSRLARLIAIVDDRLLFQETLSEVRQMRQWVLDAELILSVNFLREGSVVSNKLVARRFDAWRAKLARQLRQDGLSDEQRRCLKQFLQVLSNQRCHLIQCYDLQDFPRTNNEMERRIRAIKTRYRRISGRKNWNSYLLRYGRCVAFYDWWEQDARHSEQFLYQAAHLDRVMWRKQRMASSAATSCQLKRFCFRHKRQAVLTSLEARWEAATPTSVLP